MKARIRLLEFAPPIALNELALGTWLIVKGFDRAAVAAASL